MYTKTEILQIKRIFQIYDLVIVAFTECDGGIGNGSGRINNRCFLLLEYKNNLEQEECLIWVEKDTNGIRFDLEYFHLRKVNMVLSRIRHLQKNNE